MAGIVQRDRQGKPGVDIEAAAGPGDQDAAGASQSSEHRWDGKG